MSEPKRWVLHVVVMEEAVCMNAQPCPRDHIEVMPVAEHEAAMARKLAPCPACLGDGGQHLHTWCKEIDDRRWDAAGLLATVDTLVEVKDAALRLLDDSLKERAALRSRLAEATALLNRCATELDTVQAVENCSSELCATGEGRAAADEAWRFLAREKEKP
jgi:hypothetical protein